MQNTSNMKTSSKGFALLGDLEGLRLKAYQCTAGVWTIGYGHTSGVKKGDVCTVQQAIDWLRDDVRSTENAVNSHVLKLNQNQFDALVSFTFNVGSGNLRKSTLLKKIKANPNDKTIVDEFGKWVYSGGVKTPGLISRRKKEADFYFS